MDVDVVDNQTIGETAFDRKWFDQFTKPDQFNINNARLLYDAMCNLREKEIKAKDAEIAKMVNQHNANLQNGLEVVNGRDMTITDLKREIAKLTVDLKAEKSKHEKLKQDHQKQTKALDAAKAEGVIKKDYQANFEELKKKKKKLDDKLLLLEAQEARNEFKRIDLGLKLHKLLDDVCRFLGFPIKEHNLENNEPEREFLIYVNLFFKIKSIVKQLEERQS